MLRAMTSPSRCSRRNPSLPFETAISGWPTTRSPSARADHSKPPASLQAVPSEPAVMVR